MKYVRITVAVLLLVTMLIFAVHARDGTPYDYRRRLAGFTVTASRDGQQVYQTERSWRLLPASRVSPKFGRRRRATS